MPTIIRIKSTMLLNTDATKLWEPNSAENAAGYY